MTTVKAITHDNKSLKNIKDSNGNIIWGSQADYPYRRLEYIYFNGAEGIDLGFKPASSGNNGVQILFASITGPTASNSYGVILGCAGDTTSSGAMRILVQSSGSAVGQRVGRNSSSFGYSTTMSSNIRRYRLRTLSNSSTYIDIQNEDGTAISGTAHTTSASYTINNMPNEQLMRYNASGSIISNGYSQGNVYQFKQHTGDASTTVIKNMFPCQRKSDGVCGLYDVLNSVFYPMQGTTTTSAAAGPVTDEYWDLTA